MTKELQNLRLHTKQALPNYNRRVSQDKDAAGFATSATSSNWTTRNRWNKSLKKSSGGRTRSAWMAYERRWKKGSKISKNIGGPIYTLKPLRAVKMQENRWMHEALAVGTKKREQIIRRIGKLNMWSRVKQITQPQKDTTAHMGEQNSQLQRRGKLKRKCTVREHLL